MSKRFQYTRTVSLDAQGDQWLADNPSLNFSAFCREAIRKRMKQEKAKLED